MEHSVEAFSHVGRLASFARAIDAIRLTGSRFTPDVPRRRVRGYSQFPKVVCEPSSPFPQGGLFNVQPLPLNVGSLDEHVDVRMRLIRVQSHHVAMLECELFSRKIAYRRLNLLGRRSGGHGEDEFKYQSRRLLGLIGGQIDLSAFLDQIKIPISQ